MKTKRALLIFLLLLFLYILKPSYVQASSIDYYELFKEHGSVMLIINVDTGEIVFANKTAQTFYGYSEEELVSMTIQDINTLTPEEIALERQAAKNEERNYFIFKHRLASEEIRTVEVYSYPYVSGDNTLLFSVINDITEAISLDEEKALQRLYFEIALIIAVMLLGFVVLTLWNSRKKIKKAHSTLVQMESKLQNTISNIYGMVYRCKYDAFWTMENASAGCLALTGYSQEELINNAGIDFDSIIEEDFREMLEDKWKLSIAQKSAFEEEYIIIQKDGKKKWVHERGMVIYSKDGEVEALEGIITDISHIKASEASAREYSQKLHTTLVSVGDGVITIDEHGHIDMLNPAAEALTGWSQGEALGEPYDRICHIVDEYSKKKIECPAKQVLESRSLTKPREHSLLISRDGKETPIRDTASPILDPTGNLLGVVIIIIDNTEEREKIKETIYISYHDYLTGLYNRRFFDEELKRLDHNRDLPTSILLLDVNGLKLFNDAFGHDAGDELIEAVANVLTKVCRQGDIVARYGGDEFIVLLTGATEKVVEECAQRILQTLEDVKVREMEISISIGWATKNTEDDSLKQTIKIAEDRMYKKKALENSSKRSSVIKSIMNTLLVKNPREEAHSKRVSELCEQMGVALKLNQDDVKRLKAAGELHDIGKIAIDEAILNKPGALTPEEWKEMKKHTLTGYRIMGTSAEYIDIANAILAHHERWDGNGYPDSLMGEEIPLEARIIAIADSYDSMMSERPYRKTMNKEDAITEIISMAGTQFDPAIVKTFIEMVLN